MLEAQTRAHLLSNGDFGVLVTPAGGGYAALRGYAISPWHPDPVREAQGHACYVRDLTSGRYWSLAHLPCAYQGASGTATTFADHVQLTALCDDIETDCEIFAAAGIDAEVRRIRISNAGSGERSLDLTAYTELALNTPAAYAAHPAFSKLFIQTAFDAKREALIAWRRQRSPEDRQLWVAQRMIGPATIECDTDRANFIGRTRSVANPAALETRAPLAGSTGTVLDAAFCLRAPIDIAPGQTRHITIVTYAADSRVQLERMLDRDASGLMAANSAGHDALASIGLPGRWRDSLRLEAYDCAWQGTQKSRDAQPQSRTRDYGSFSEDGREYVVTVGAACQPTPQPWINVLANEEFGCLVSETGAGYVWAANSRENRITPWTNDAVSDPHTDALYVRDNRSGQFWSALPGPAPGAGDYEVRHGFGYSRFRSRQHSLELDAHVFVARTDPVRLLRLAVTNHGSEERSLSLISYAQLVLGGHAAETRTSVATSYDAASAVVYATNACRAEFSKRVAFAAAIAEVTPDSRSATGSRASFVGAHKALSAPEALEHERLDGRFGAGLDPCAALQIDVSLAAGATFECAFMLGEAEDAAAASACAERFRSVEAVDAAHADVVAYWQGLLSGVQAHTPVRAFDVMLNGWLAYQNLACRMWARSAFYQSGGAFGFRDQLQDSSALLYLDPAITRNQILLHAAHQFLEGDVLHWWHPPTSKGIRTRFSDDLLWLPYIALFYLARTGDSTLLGEQVRYISAQLLEPGNDEIFVWPEVANGGTIYDHCCRALDRSLTRGGHGLPLIGVGDWNDGMNRVGREGRGESVWLGFFLFDILHDFIPICVQHADSDRAERYNAYLAELAHALESAGWDGEWYRRAYYDDGTPIGSATSDECRIDALAQAWAVLSRAAPHDRAQLAIAAMKDRLVSEDDGIIRLLTPPFDRTPHDPGYIKGYVPGVRENGGQYTHAAIWAVRALAELNDPAATRLLELLTPISHTRSPAAVDTYKGEPYVVAADVYGVAPHVGRAGWTWYTGSAGWLYRVILESILGFTIQDGNAMKLRPCIPADWPGFTLSYRFPDGTCYSFVLEQGGEATTTTSGSVEDRTVIIPAELDGGDHEVRISLGRDVGPRYHARAQSGTSP